MIGRRAKYIGGSIILALVGLFFYFYSVEGIGDYKPQRDRDDIIAIFKNDWYWLIPEETTDFSPEYVLDTKSSSKKPEHKGNLTIKVCRTHGQFCGFVAYYKEAPYKGRVLFLATSSQHRGQGFGKKLLEYALRDLVGQGCVVITIFTRVNNERALGLYTGAGFKENWRNEKYVRLSRRS